MTDTYTHRQSFVVPRGGTGLVGDRWPGEGPTIVLVHAGVADRRSWQDVAGLLAGPATVVTYDCRGYGESPLTPGPFTHLDDLLAVLDEMTAGQVWLGGSSMGGRIALDAAITAPDRIAGLVLLAPGISGVPQARLDPDSERLVALLETADAAGDSGQVGRLLTHLWLDGPSAAEGRVSGPARNLALDMISIIIRNDTPEDPEDAGVDAWNRLAEVTVPAVVACGDLDLPYLVSDSRHLTERLPLGRHRVLPGMAHLPYLENPPLIAGLIAGALADGKPTGGPAGSPST